MKNGRVDSSSIRYGTRMTHGVLFYQRRRPSTAADPTTAFSVVLSQPFHSCRPQMRRGFSRNATSFWPSLRTLRGSPVPVTERPIGNHLHSIVTTCLILFQIVQVSVLAFPRRFGVDCSPRSAIVRIVSQKAIERRTQEFWIG